MVQMMEAKVIQINDGIYNGTYEVGDNITFFWLTSTDSFKKYFDEYCKNNSMYDDEGYIGFDEWEMYGELKGWTETCLQIDLEHNRIIEIPILDITSICM